MNGPTRQEKTSQRGPLPVAELRRRRRELVMAVALILSIAAVLVVMRHASGASETVQLGDNLLFLFLNAVNVIFVVLLEVFLYSPLSKKHGTRLNEIL